MDIAVEDIKSKGDLSNSTVINFNGDDALVLKNAGTIIDSFGQVGVDPGTAWGTGDVTTVDHTLIRNSSIITGDTNPNDAFDPATEWTALPKDTFTNLGSHTMDGDSTPVETKVEAVTASTPSSVLRLAQPLHYQQKRLMQKSTIRQMEQSLLRLALYMQNRLSLTKI